MFGHDKNLAGILADMDGWRQAAFAGATDEAKNDTCIPVSDF
jgi:hypothetical protein